tara:strand:+ start:82 stop:5187 length:5106 start_codon:yes stop_codon:yes gene_type:complete
MSCAEVQIKYQGTGSQSQFAFPFPYQFKSEIIVSVWNNTTKEYDQKLTTDGTYPWRITDANPTIVEFTGTVPPSPPASGVNEGAIYNLKIERLTDITDVRAVFNAGSSIRATDLNTNYEQLRFAILEGRCQVPQPVLDYLNEYFWNNYNQTVYSTSNGGSWVSADNRIATTAALDERFQDEANETILSTESWVSDDDHIATTAALDARFQDELSETITSAESWPNDDNTIATTAKIDDVIDLAIENDILINATGLTKSATGGQTTIGIGANSVDLDRIKTADIVQTSAYSSTWTNVDDQVATVGALAARLDAVVSSSQPTTTQTGKFWYNPTEGVNALYMWNGTDWKVLTSGTPYIPAGTTIVRYVDQVNGSDDASNLGFLPQSPLKTIKRAITLINASASGDGTLVVVEPGVYQEVLPLTIQKNNISVVGKSIRSCFIHPTVATENNNMWEVDSGTYISGFTMLGLKVPTSDQGSRNNTLDNDATYGIPSNQPFAISFRSGNPVILKSPYIQNCTHFSDAHFDNANFDPNTFQSTDAQTYSAVAGDETSAPCGGGLLVDGSVPATTSPIRSMVVDAFTQITLDGPGILVTNNGYAQLVSFFGTFCHYHAKAKNGGQINLSNCVTDFGRYGLIAEGKSPVAIASATASAANSGATTVTIGAIASAASFHGTVSRPLDHMMLTVDGNDYGVVSSVANGSGWDVTITPALSQTISNTAVTFALRSYISTGGHTFEYVGVGTDYSDHPDKGGVAIEANQVKQLSGGKVWQSSTDHIGKFKAGNVVTVDQIAETLAVNGSVTVTGTNAVNGNITVTGTVDGRDVATDGTKLDTIETGATADQTAAEIRTLVEAATDSNVFTDADHTKLNGIETGATGDQTNAEIRTAVEAASDSNVFTDADHTKLNGIASGATAYTNTNVDAHLNTSTASNGEVLSWNGSDYDWTTAAAGYSDSDVDTHLNRSTAATGEVLSWNGSDYDWTTAASGGATDINGLSDAKSGAGYLGMGSAALNNITSGYGITAVGISSQYTVTNGANYNTSLGNNTLYYNTSGEYGVAIGYYALQNQTTGDTNTAVGAQALKDCTTGSKNIAIGSSALYTQTTGSRNVAIGNDSQYRNRGGQNNTSVGFESLYENSNGSNKGYNTAIGSYALRYNTEEKNTALGYKAGYLNTTGDNNVFVGSEAGTDCTTASFITAVGTAAGANVTTGNSNTTIGSYSLYKVTTGQSNVAVGASVLYDCVTGANNTAVGHQAANNTTSSSNTAVGSQALYKNVSGTFNVALGYQALYENTTSYNTAVGYKAGTETTSGNHNCFFGYQAGENNTIGGYNVAIGDSALINNTSAYFGVATGMEALKNNTTGGNNVATGGRALLNNTTGSNNVATGYSALANTTTGSDNVANGYWALRNNTTGVRNVGVGYEAAGGLGSNRALYNTVGIGYKALANTTSNSNTAVGYQAGMANTTGLITAFGDRAGQSNTSGSITAIGVNALQYNTTGNRNTAVGHSALDENTTGSNNTAVGYETLNKNTTGYENSAFGYYALRYITTGSYNTGLGKYAGDLTTTGNYNTSIGYESDPSSATVSGQFTLGNSNLTALRCNTQTITSISDGRDKTEVQPLAQGLDFIDSLQPVKFKWETRDGNAKDGTYEAGFIAQDLQSAQSKVDADYLGLVMDDNPERLEASYGKLIPVLVQAIKDLKSEIETLKSNV